MVLVPAKDMLVKARKEGLLSLEDAINNLDDKFLKKGLQMVVDGIEPDSIKEILELDISALETRHAENANMFAMLGVYGPSMGMLGTLIGLIQMLANLTDATTIATGPVTPDIIGTLVPKIPAIKHKIIAPQIPALAPKPVATPKARACGSVIIEALSPPNISPVKIWNFSFIVIKKL